MQQQSLQQVLALSTNAAIKIGGNNTQTTNIQGAVANTAVGGSKSDSKYFI